MQSEINQIVPIISTRDTDWEARVKALRKLNELSHSAASSSSDVRGSFVARLCELDVRNGFSVQICELRSSVVKEACIALEGMAQVLGKDVEPLFDSLVDPLLTVLASSNRVLCSCSDHALKSCLETSTISHRGLERICDIMKNSKHILQKRVAVECLSIVLELSSNYETSFLDSHAHTIGDSIKIAMADRASDVRTAARQAFFPFRAVWPERANALEKSLDSQQKRYLASEKYTPRVKRVNSSSPSATESSASATKSDENKAGMKRGSPSVLPASERMAKPTATATASSISSKCSTASKVEQNDSKNKEATAPAGKQPRLLFSQPAPQKETRGERLVQSERVPAPSSVMKKPLSSSARAPLSTVKKTTPSNVTTGIQSATKRTGLTNSGRNISTFSVKPRDIFGTNSKETVKKENGTMITANDPVKIIVGGLVDPNKEVCVKAFTLLSQMVVGPRSSELITEMNDIVSGLCTHIPSHDHDISGSALKLLIQLVKYYKGIVAFLDRLNPVVFSKFSVETEEKQKQLLGTVFETLLNTIPLDSLVPSLTGSMDTNNPFSSKTALIMFKNVIDASPEFFKSVHHILPCLNPLRLLAESSNDEVCSMAREILINMFELWTSEFTSAVWQLSRDDQKNLRRIVPRLEAEQASCKAVVNAAADRKSCENQTNESISSSEPAKSDEERKASIAFSNVASAAAIVAAATDDNKVSPSSSSSSIEGSSSYNEQSIHPKMREYIEMISQVSSKTYQRKDLVNCISGLIECVGSCYKFFSESDITACVEGAAILTDGRQEQYIRFMALSLLQSCAKSLALNSSHIECALKALLAASYDLNTTGAATSSATVTEKARLQSRECQQTLEARFTSSYLIVLMNISGQTSVPVPQRELCLDKLISVCKNVEPSVLESVSSDLITAMEPLFDVPEDVLRRKASSCVAEWSLVLKDSFQPRLEALPELKQRIVQLVIQGQKQGDKLHEEQKNEKQE